MRWRFAVASALFYATGCSMGSGEPPEPIPGSGSPPVECDGYPTDNQGTKVGSVVKKYVFPGYVNPSQATGEAARVEIKLCDFYNPTGDGTYPEGSPFPPGEPLPVTLVINVGAGWCGPCKQEAASVLPKEYATYHPRGMELLFVMFDNNSPGTPAGFTDLEAWTSTFSVGYPSVIDPGRQMAEIGDPSQFPFNLIIDTRTMKIVQSVTGIPPATFWTQVDELLAE